MSSVRDNAASSRFELEVEGEMAFVTYRLASGVMALTYTYTPPQLREHGVGTRVVLGALAAARAQGLKVQPTCGFVRFVIAQHPEYADLVA